MGNYSKLDDNQAKSMLNKANITVIMLRAKQIPNFFFTSEIPPYPKYKSTTNAL